MAGKILLLAAIRGLVSEGERVRTIINNGGIDAVALSVSPEGVAAMKDCDSHTPAMKAPANIEEEIYMVGLSNFGEVVKPPPCFSVAQDCAMAANIPVEGLDMDDEHYTAAYCKFVTTIDMMRQGSSRKRLSRYAFRAEMPEEFVMEWDYLVNRLKGYRELENAREEWLAKGIAGLSEKYGSVLAVMELERVEGIKRCLDSSGIRFEEVH